MSINPTTTTQYYWFGTRSVDFVNGTNTGAQLEILTDDTEFATRTYKDGSTVDYTGSEWKQFLAFTGTVAEMTALGVNVLDGTVDTAATGQVNTTGDLRVGEGVTAHNIADINGGRIVDVSGLLDEADDPFVITGLGRAGPGKLDSASIDAGDTGNRIMFSDELGFGLIGNAGFDPNGNAARLNDGESINFEMKLGKVLLMASFTVKVLNGGSTAVIIDSDGATIRDTNGDLQGGFVQDASSGELNLGSLDDGTKVTINYENETIWFNGGTQFLGDTTGFFAAFVESGSVNLTIGSVVGNQVGWSADDLVLAADYPNQVPVADGYTGGTGDEDNAISGDVNAHDPDGDTLTYSVAAFDQPANGTVWINAATGEFTYTPAANFNGNDSFIVTISDGRGGVTTQAVAIVVNAVNDAASFGGDNAGNVAEDGTLLASGTLTVSDVDLGEANFASTSALAGMYGDFTFTLATGEWTYTLRNGDANVQALNTGDTEQDSLTVFSTDGSSTTVTVDVAGADEPPPPNAVLPSAFTGTGDSTDTLGAGAAGSITATPPGGGASQTIRGTTGNDVIAAGGGGDTVYAYGGADSINGQGDGDVLYGQEGNDTLLGDAANDRLFGGSGADSISGGAGADTLVGGYGADTLTGGADTDRYRFTSLNDTNDIITDFDSAEVLDFSAFGALSLLATQSTVFTANNQVAWYHSGGDTIVMLNTDGNNATAEFMVTLQGYTTNMVLNDFVFAT